MNDDMVVLKNNGKERVVKTAVGKILVEKYGWQKVTEKDSKAKPETISSLKQKIALFKEDNISELADMIEQEKKTLNRDKVIELLESKLLEVGNIDLGKK